MKKFTIISALFLLLFGVEQLNAQWIRPAQYQDLLGRGTDVDWWTDGQDYSSYDWDRIVSDFSDAGIQHIRITIGRDVMNEVDLQRLDHQINACLHYGIAPVVAYRPDYLRGLSPAYRRARMTNWWRVVAERYRDYSPRLSFDILLEPNSSMFASYGALNDFYDECVTTIRVSNPYRILFIAPTYNSDPMYLKYLRIPRRADGYLMAEWHFMPQSNYRRAWSNWINRRDYSERWFNDRIRAAAAWQTSTGILTWVGSWGGAAYFSTTYTDEAAAFTQFICAALAAVRIPFAVHGVAGYYNPVRHGWYASARRPMGAIFPRGGFGPDRRPEPRPHRGDGFSIGGRRFDFSPSEAPRNGFRNDGRRDDYRRDGFDVRRNGSGNNRDFQNRSFANGNGNRNGQFDRNGRRDAGFDRSNGQYNAPREGNRGSRQNNYGQVSDRSGMQNGRPAFGQGQNRNNRNGQGSFGRGRSDGRPQNGQVAGSNRGQNNQQSTSPSVGRRQAETKRQPTVPESRRGGGGFGNRRDVKSI